MHGDGIDGRGKGRDESCMDVADIEKQGSDSANGSFEPPLQPPLHPPLQPPPALLVTVVVSAGESVVHHEATQKASEAVDCFVPEKGYLSRTGSSHEQCRVCQQDNEEMLIDLGCHCRGELAKAHRSCIDTWFRTKGSNKCEICQESAANVTPPESFPTTNYWVWRVDPALTGSVLADQNGRACSKPLWVAFSILIGGLLLDVFISVTLGVSALPVNIIIGIIIVLGLGTAVRLTVEFIHEWNMRRSVQRVARNPNPEYHSAF